MNQLIEAEAAPIPLRSTFGAAWGLRRPGCEDVPPAEDGLHLQGTWPRQLLNFDRLTKGQSDRWPSLPSENQNARHAQAQKASLYRGNRQNFSEASDLRKIRLMSCTIAGHNLWLKPDCGPQGLCSLEGGCHWSRLIFILLDINRKIAWRLKSVPCYAFFMKLRKEVAHNAQIDSFLNIGTSDSL